ncbi:hypothetical protein [Basfia succiniciproducens]|uniref:hypothetical protein n=1 Tax=Basfia succiniciproducens TaxID=653940 RepID=UPI0008ADB1F5|nr:hypothetical protein [Basfia succiniciproducens]SEQ73795.1 hypothetical protein SAMN02910415_01974 [Basfia succiniciproducens]
MTTPNLNSVKHLSLDSIDELYKLTEQTKSLLQIVVNDGHDLEGFVSSQQVIIGTLWTALDLVAQIRHQIDLAQ